MLKKNIMCSALQLLFYPHPTDIKCGSVGFPGPEQENLPL